jgi:hypothetical protein
MKRQGRWRDDAEGHGRDVVNIRVSTGAAVTAPFREQS